MGPLLSAYYPTTKVNATDEKKNTEALETAQALVLGLQEILADCPKENKPKILEMINELLGSEPTLAPGKRKHEFAEPKAAKNLKPTKCPEELENVNAAEAPEPDVPAAAYADTKPLVPEVPDLTAPDKKKQPDADADDVDTIRKQLEEQRLVRAMNKEKNAQKPGPKKASKKSRAAKKDQQDDDTGRHDADENDEAEDEMQAALEEQDKDMKKERETEDEKAPRRGRGRGRGRGRSRGRGKTQKRKENDDDQENEHDAENPPAEKKQKVGQEETTEATEPAQDSLVECARPATSQTKMLWI